MEQITFLVDLDRVLHDIDHPVPGRRMGPPIEGAKEAIEELVSEGHRIVVFTLRGKSKHVMEWMEYWDIPYHDITNQKTDGIIIDDRCVRFRSWDQTLRELRDSLGDEGAYPQDS